MIFGIGTSLIFLNPKLSSNEIFPYYALALPLFNYSKRIILIIFVILLFGIINQIIFNDSRSVINAIQIAVLLATLYAVQTMCIIELRLISKIFNIFILMHLSICIFQYIYPESMNLSYWFFSSRESQVEQLLLRSAVVGLGPEPAYVASLLCGMLLFSILLNGFNFLIISMVVIQLFLLKSVVGYILFFIIFNFFILKFKKYKYLIIMVIITLISLFSGLMERLSIYISNVYTMGSIFSAEVSTGSTRLANLRESLELIISFPGIGFSPFGAISYAMHGSIFASIIILAMFKIKINALEFMVGLAVFIFFGPILIWPMYYLLTPYFLNSISKK
ncbi:hypothetical protein ICV89_01720 [Polynucleobacter sp. Adler-ghost]|nr:hypothetical protein ICV89_01720 [Polynucleobacter sp. Adler-ghost]